ncbi:aquaporin [Ramlibacter humi]|uniref:Aquaporin family protein n=1 Tax=Ramlibacter humi TaxID=2530451 RepID=A0A4Z0BIU2_9BURK|nr:aquaporin [Ramlibacter humi]TFY98177.1 aquaporin family protein [Ramlibacter humi]
MSRRLFAEFLGTLLLLAAVIGSGIMGERLAQGNAAVALLANTMATVFALFVLIETLGPVSGAHFNPVVTLAFGRAAGLERAEQVLYVAAQLAGAAAGAVLANAMFDLPLLQWAAKARGGAGQWLAEVVATAGLVLVIARAGAGRAPMLVAAYIGSAYWFTSSTSFANPAAAFGRMFSDSFAGIAPASITAFIASQAAGGVLGVLLSRALKDA